MKEITLLVVPACGLAFGDDAKGATRGADIGSDSSLFYGGLVVAVSY